MSIDSGQVGGVVFLDLKKAFDMVDHDILLRKLCSIGISASSCKWFSSYLKGCRQLTKVNSRTSTKATNSHGVPQGSILGPLLFLIFINDLPNMIELCGVSLYTDDTAIFYFSDDIDDVRLSIQHDLQSVSVWMKENRLSLNIKKTKFMQLGSKRHLNSVPTISVSLNGERISNVQEFKYLGLILDKYPLFDRHIEHIVDKTTTKLGLIYKTRWLFKMETAKMLYSSLVTSYFDLGNTLYTVAAQYQLNRLQVIQNAAAR